PCAGRGGAPSTRCGDRTARARTPRRSEGPGPRPTRRAGRAGPPARGGRPRRSCRRTEERFPHPGRARERITPEGQPLLRARPVSRDDASELVPVRLPVLPHAVVALAQLRVGHLEAELPDLRDVAVEELLARLLVALALDPPVPH